ncbi:general substrate transporter [Calocera cornea HHB12733]|uniref:General substrate transporter n=1 Tax=Calocera cornea HHB12733 TaxID=1353952 RepID=A0A165FCM5_9BASI|nr:general substrate transporter [Calocera cornea HHB12733]
MSLVYFSGVVLWTTIPAFEFGYHTSALNQLQATMSCVTANPTPGALNLPSCIPMSDTKFGILTSALTLGGLVGSLWGGYYSDRLGRKGASVLSSALFFLGALAMAGAWAYPVLVLGRLFTGIGSGMGLCVVPVMLSELAAPKMKGAMGTLNQLAIVVGILLTQAIGLVMARQGLWRQVLVIAAGICALQLVSAPFIHDTPAWLEDHDRDAEAKRAAVLLWGEADPTLGDEEVPEEEAISEQQPLFEGEDAAEDVPATPKRLQPATFRELFTSPALRRPVIVVLLCFLAQQGSGINSVIYYSTNILGRLAPTLSPYISLIIAVINALMTFPPVFLIDRIGKRTIMQLSIIACVLFGILITVGLNVGQPVVSAVGIIGFVAAFAAGLGPVPYVITAQIAPYHAVSTLAALALSMSWIVNFFVALGFLPLRNLLSLGRGLDGNVFIVFLCILAFCGVSLWRL